MNKKVMKLVSGCLCVALAAGSIGATVYALNNNKSDKAPKETTAAATTDKNDKISKDETVYVLAGADGSVKKIIVSDWIKNSLASSSLNDKSDLNNVVNVKGDEKYTMNGDNMRVWDAQGKDIYYQGNIEKEIPVNMTVSYTLDGKSISPKDLAGKSGRVVIRYDYKNNQFAEVKIDGKTEKINVPFAMLTGIILDTKVFSNVKVSNGKLINDGDRMAVIGVALPGLQNNLKLDKSKLELPEYVEISADVKNFELATTMTVATNELFSAIDSDKLNSIDDLTKSLDDLNNAMNQLMDGSSKLYGGLCTLLDKSKELVAGIDKLSAGAQELKKGTGDLDAGAAQLKQGILSLYEGLNQLSSNNDTLNGGAKQVFETLLSTANTQLAAAGITVPTLTIENYAEVLNKVIDSLDEKAVKAQALATVTEKVNQNRPLIEQGVTAAAKEKVAVAVIKKATGMSKEDYDKAVKAGLVKPEIQAKINAAIEAQMQTDEIKATIAENIELTVKQKIAEGMNSDDVKQKLAQAAKGRESIIALKKSLDSYNQFYVGLKTYTGGVADAANGSGALKDGSDTLKDGTSKLYAGMNELCNGILQIKDGAPALISGVTELRDGSMQISEGLKQFNEQGVQKLVDAVNGDIGGLVTRVRATVDVSKNYKSFSGISDDMDGQVKFIYRTDSIKTSK